MEKSIRQFQPSCIICGSNEKMSIDHVYPFSKGHLLNPGNAVRLCVHCNTSKTDKYPQQLDPYRCYKILFAAQAFKNYWESIQ